MAAEDALTEDVPEDWTAEPSDEGGSAPTDADGVRYQASAVADEHLDDPTVDPGDEPRVPPAKHDESLVGREGGAAVEHAPPNLPEVTEDTDGRRLFEPESRYAEPYRKEQKWEGIYLGTLLAFDLTALAIAGLGGLGGLALAPTAQRFFLLALGGLLGGLVYGGKWLYHAIAKGLWHQDRRMWRILSPWMSVGTTIGIWALMDSGFFPSVPDTTASGVGSLATPVGIGFVIGYLSDSFLAKMKELTEVLFGRSEQHYWAESDEPSINP